MKTGLSDALFSTVQKRVLGLLFGQPDRSFRISDIVNSLHSGTGAVEREIKRLADSGLVTIERIGKRKEYHANKQSPIFSELQSIVMKTVGLIEPVRQALADHEKKIDTAFVFGSVAKGTDTASSDIDLIVVSNDITYTDVFGQLQIAEQILQRQINPLFFSLEEWREKVQHQGSFIEKISHQPKMFIFGSSDVLTAPSTKTNSRSAKRTAITDLVDVNPGT